MADITTAAAVGVATVQANGAGDVAVMGAHTDATGDGKGGAGEGDEDEDDVGCECSCHWCSIACDFKFDLGYYDTAAAAKSYLSECGPCSCESCWELLSEECVVAKWTRSTALYDHHESSFIEEPTSTDVKHPNRRAYDDSTSPELRQFIQDRGLQDPFPGRLMMKYYYIRVLEAADRDAHFDLLGLPAELRVWVYRHLLVNKEARDRDTSILRACKLVSKEASDVLYSDNVIECKFTVKTVGVHGTSHEALIDGRLMSVYPRYRQEPWKIIECRQFLQRVRRLEIRLVLTVSPESHLGTIIGRELGYYLLTLTSFLMGQHSIKNLRVTVSIYGSMDREWAWGHILYTLRRLRNIAHVTVDANVPKRFREPLTKDMQSSKPTFNTVKQMLLLLGECKDQLAMLYAICPDDLDACSCGACPGRTPRIWCLEELRGSVLLFAPDAFHTSRSEQNLQARLELLHTELDDIDIKKAKKALARTEKAKLKVQKGMEESPDTLRSALETWYDDVDDEDKLSIPIAEEWPEIG